MKLWNTQINFLTLYTWQFGFEMNYTFAEEYGLTLAVKRRNHMPGLNEVGFPISRELFQKKSDISQKQAKKEWSFLLCALLTKWVPVEDDFGEIFPDKKHACMH